MKNKITIRDAARVMGIDVLTVREGILAGIFPIGNGFKKPGSSTYTFFISPKLFYEYTGYDFTTEEWKVKES